MSLYFEIQIATMSDVREIEACACAAYQKYVERMGRKPAPMVADFAEAIEKQQIYVARPAGALIEILGFVVFYPRGDHLHLENLAVHPEHQGQGFGRQLITFVEKHAQMLDLKAVELYTNEKMTENLSLYAKLGYQETDRRQEDGFNRIYFRKIID